MREGLQETAEMCLEASCLYPDLYFGILLHCSVYWGQVMAGLWQALFLGAIVRGEPWWLLLHEVEG